MGYDDVDIHITLLAQGVTYGYEGVEDAGEWIIKHTKDGVDRYDRQHLLRLVGTVITDLMAIVSEASGGYVMGYRCDDHPDREAFALFTVLDGGEVQALCGECVPLFASAVCRSVGWTVSEQPAAGTTAKVSPIGQGTAGKRRRAGKAAKDTGELPGESTQPELVNRCDAQAVENCAGRGLVRPDLTTLDSPDAAAPVMCGPCYTAVTKLLTEVDQQQQNTWEDDGGTVAGHDDDELTGEQAAAAAATVTEA